MGGGSRSGGGGGSDAGKTYDEDKEASYDKSHEMAAEQVNMTKAEWAKLTLAEQEAVMAYTGGLYSKLNESLRIARGDLAKARFSKYRPDQNYFRKTAVNINSAIIKGRGLPKNTVLYRSTTLRPYGHEDVKTAAQARSLIGKTLKAKNFQSMTYSKGYAESWDSKDRIGNQNFILRIKASAGLPGIVLGNSYDRSNNPVESEFVGGIHTNYRVTGVKEEGGRTYIDVTASGRKK